MKAFRNSSDKGIALLMVLWVLVILLTLVLSFSYMSRLQTSTEIFFSEYVKENLMLRGLLHRAFVEIIYSKIFPDSEDRWSLLGSPNRITIQGQTFYVEIKPETSRLDLNRSSELILKGLLRNLGVQEERINIIVDSLLDWRDGDNLHRLNGAEDEYYGSLPRPYACRNGNLQSVEEWLLIRGMDEELFYGNDRRPGIREFVTVYNTSGRININSAPAVLLMALPGMSKEIVDAIVEYRNTNPFKSHNEIMAVVGTAYQSIARYITFTDDNGIFRFLIYRENSPIVLEAVARVTTTGYRILYIKPSVRETGNAQQ